jgi:NitT/TauT family transport system permease protein
LLLEALTRAELADPRYLPPASSVLVATVRILFDPSFVAAALGTIGAWAFGLALAIAIATPLGVLLGSSRRSYLASTTAVEFLRPIPSVALIPLAVLILGSDLRMKAALICYACVWPILFNTIYGMHDVDPIAKDTARSFGYRGAAVLWKVSLPSAAPFIYTGIRIAAAIALIVGISTELIASGSAGIGTWMYAHSESGIEREYVYAGTIFAGILGLTINAVMVAGERRVFAWHQANRPPA